ncbi:MAG: hypothetical protein LUC38_01500 [Oscillospiraceae bacterium]|nr:hypothetical protein [Ruminococcus sp.]MCD8344626.1 hypothetical protein [Oscillospiraceae bacterium]
MNVLYCGDENIERGLIISILSLLKNIHEELHVWVLTAEIDFQGKHISPVKEDVVSALREHMQGYNGLNSITMIDVSELFEKEIPVVNMGTRFTPFCMLRLFADDVPEIPDKIMYLDNDVVCRRNPSEFYNQDISEYELAGVLDYYGSWFFRRNPFKRDYLNSGVLLMNMSKIRETGLFKNCRKRCCEKEMFMPDQSAINKLAASKKICPRKFNEQRKLQSDTVMQHFTTSFRFFPYIRTVTVKPWDIDRLHEVLKLHEYDDLLSEYTVFYNSITKNRQ